MANITIEKTPFLFPVFFVLLWLAISTILGLLSGWFWLMVKYPDRAEEPTLRIRCISGSMGIGVGMRGILRLSVCPSGLRIGMMRIFGPFCRDFLVPWEEITVRRRRILFWTVVTLRFGASAFAKLTISGGIANRLARAAAERWPETEPIAPEQPGALCRRLLGQWALLTTIAVSFFILVPRIMAPDHPGIPVPFAMLFPAIVFGLAMVVQYFRERR